LLFLENSNTPLKPGRWPNLFVTDGSVIKIFDVMWTKNKL